MADNFYRTFSCASSVAFEIDTLAFVNIKRIYVSKV